MTKELKARPTPVPPQRRPLSSWWLLSKRGVCRTEVLTVGCDGGQALPVFSGDGEAELFAWLGGAFEDGWRPREASVGELISTLCGPCAREGRGPRPLAGDDGRDYRPGKHEPGKVLGLDRPPQR